MSSVGVPVLFLGGPRRRREVGVGPARVRDGVLAEVRDVMTGGAAGLAIGRALIHDPEPGEMARQVADIVHGSAAEATCVAGRQTTTGALRPECRVNRAARDRSREHRHQGGLWGQDGPVGIGEVGAPDRPARRRCGGAGPCGLVALGRRGLPSMPLASAGRRAAAPGDPTASSSPPRARPS